MSKMQEDLKLREAIRDMEEKINRVRLDICLPSEDSIMDEPGRYSRRMVKLLTELEQHLKRCEGMNKKGFW